MNRLAIGLVVSLGSLAVGSGAASAIPLPLGTATIRITNGVNVKTIVDNDAFDTQNMVDGMVSFTGTVGNWTVNVSFGETKPSQGTAAIPSMDFTFNAKAATGPSTTPTTLKIEFSDINYGPLTPGTMAASSIGGTLFARTGSSLTYATYLGTTNTIFDETGTPLFTQTFTPTLVALPMPHLDGSYSGAGTQIVGPPPPNYSLTQVITITHPTRGSTSTSSGDATLDLTPVPEPSALLLLGSGLAGFGYLRLRRRVKA